MEETKSRRVFDFTSRDVPRVDEGKKERKKERKNSLELFLDEGDRRPRRRPRRRLVRDPLFFFVVEAKRHPRDGDSFFSALFFFCGKPNKTEREKIIWNGKRRRKDSLFVSFLMFRYNSLFISLLFVATTTTTRTTTRTRTTTTTTTTTI